jgi:hypothetical protein
MKKIFAGWLADTSDASRFFFMGEDGAGGARFLTDSITQDFLKGQYQEIFIEVFFFLELYFTVRGSRSYF